MRHFFTDLVNEKLIDDICIILDWLFDEGKFPENRKWNPGYVSSYSKKVKKLITNGGTFDYNSKRKMRYLNNREECPCVYISGSDSLARDLIRHIRNGIAHGRCELYKAGKYRFIEIYDYSDSSGNPEKQTAYLNVPIGFLLALHETYTNMEKSIRNTKKKDRAKRAKMK